MTKWARVQLPTGNGIVQETTTSNPAGKYHPNITWVEVTAGNSPSGNIAAVGVRYSYEPTPSPAFTAPVFVTGNAKLFNSGSFIPSVSFTGSGDWNWTTIGIVNLLATISTTQVVAFSTQLFDSNLVVAPTTIIMPSGSGQIYEQGAQGDPPGGSKGNDPVLGGGGTQETAAIGGLFGDSGVPGAGGGEP